jgi:hypothetical protein
MVADAINAASTTKTLHRGLDVSSDRPVDADRRRK